MSLSRRQLLIGGGAVGGLGLVALSQRLLSSPVSQTAGVAPSPSASLISAPSPIGPKGMFAPLRGDVRLAVISDLNSSYGSTDYEPEVVQAIGLIPDWQPDLVICGGDMVAGQDSYLTVAKIQAMWAGFDRNIGAPLRKAKLPYGFTVGNHDASSSTAPDGSYLFEVERQQTAEYWTKPEHDPGLNFIDRSGFPFNYTFEHNQIFYLAWDASSNIISKPQLDWVEKSLISQAAQSAKLRIVIGHLPLFAVAVSRDDPAEVLADSERLRLLLEKYHVHTYISGHDHAYYPAYKGNLQLLHTGALGSGPRPWLNSNLAPMKTLTIVDVSLSTGTTTYTTYNMRTLKVVNQQELPRVIVGPTGMVVRRDVPLADLTPAEKALTWSPSG